MITIKAAQNINKEHARCPTLSFDYFAEQLEGIASNFEELEKYINECGSVSWIPIGDIETIRSFSEELIHYQPQERDYHSEYFGAWEQTSRNVGYDDIWEQSEPIEIHPVHNAEPTWVEHYSSADIRGSANQLIFDDPFCIYSLNEDKPICLTYRTYLNYIREIEISKPMEIRLLNYFKTILPEGDIQKINYSIRDPTFQN